MNDIPAANRAVTARDNNPPDFAKLETARLVEENVGLTNTFAELEIEAAKFIEAGRADDDPTLLRIGGVIKRFRDLRERMEQTRVVEVEPHLRRQNAINAFFNGWRKKIQPDDKAERRSTPGLIDKLQGIIDAAQARKEAAERQRLEAERLERERVAQAARDAEERQRAEAAKAEREAREKQEAADRARNADIKAAKQREADEAAAKAQAAAAASKSAEVATSAAEEQATDARIGTLAKPQDLVRRRGVTEEGAGVTLTTQKEPYAFINDRTQLLQGNVPARLFVYFNDKEVEKAVRAFAKATNHNEALPGCEIGWRRRGVTR